MISCVLLVAGDSSRFGSPKALARLGAVTVLEFLLNKLILTDVAEVVLVLGAHAQEIRPHVLKHPMVKIIYNEDYKEGQTFSFKAGLSVVSSSSCGIMLLPIDYPFIQIDTFTMLVRDFETHRPHILIPTYNLQKGHPPIFSSELKKKFFILDNNLGINEMAHQHKFITLPVKDEGVIATFNTPDEFSSLKAKYAL